MGRTVGARLRHLARVEGAGLQARITHFSAEEKPAGWREKYPVVSFYSFTIPVPFSFEISFRVKVFPLLSLGTLK